MSTWPGVISRDIMSDTMLRLAPLESRKAAAVKSFSVVEEKVKEPVSSYIPRHMTVASSEEISIPFSLRMWVRMVTVAPVGSWISIFGCMSLSEGGWWS